MRIHRIPPFYLEIVAALALFGAAQFCMAQGNPATTRANNPDGSTTVTTTTTYPDGSTSTETNYDKDGHDAGTTRTDVQSKDGETTTTITKYDGNGHEIGKTVTRVDKNGNTTVTNYDANGQPAGSSTLPPFKYKPDWKIGLDYKVPPEFRYLPKLEYEAQNPANPTPPKAGTTQVSNAGGTTITTVTIFSDGWIITVTRYDRDGHDAGTTRTDVQTKDGQTTTTTTNWDGNGHEIGKTIERVSADGSKTTITYDGQGHETGRTTVPGSSAANGKDQTSSLNSGACPGSNCPPPKPASGGNQLCPNGVAIRDPNQCNPGPSEPCEPGKPCEGPGETPPGYRIKWVKDQWGNNKPELERIPEGEGPPGFAQTISGLTVRHMLFCDEQQPHSRGEGGKDFQPLEEQLQGGCQQLRKQVQEQNQRAPLQGPTSPTTVGIVLPAQASGQISGTITTEPKRYQGIPGLQVITAIVPLQTGGDGKPSLRNLMVDAGNHVLQPADEGITLKVPAAGTVMRSGSTIEIPGREITLLPSGNPAVNVPIQTTNPSLTVTGTPIHPRGERGQFAVRSDAEGDAQLSGGEPSIQLDTKAITTPPVCFRGSVSVIHGAGGFSGDASQMLVMLGDQVLKPTAANQDAVFFDIPANLPDGPVRLTFVDGLSAATAQVTTLKLATSVEQPALRKGQRTNGRVRLTIPGLPPQAFGPVAGVESDLVDMGQFHKIAPDFQPPQAGQPGIIFVGMVNRSPQRISIEGFKGVIRTYSLNQGSLPFNEILRIRAITDGDFDIGVFAQPFLAPVPMEKVTFRPSRGEVK